MWGKTSRELRERFLFFAVFRCMRGRGAPTMVFSLVFPSSFLLCVSQHLPSVFNNRALDFFRELLGGCWLYQHTQNTQPKSPAVKRGFEPDSITPTPPTPNPRPFPPCTKPLSGSTDPYASGCRKVGRVPVKLAPPCPLDRAAYPITILTFAGPPRQMPTILGDSIEG